MNGDQEDIIRLNIERFEQLLSQETEPARRKTLSRLLMEARAEREFLSESYKAKMGSSVRQTAAELIPRWRRKAEECRTIAHAYRYQSTREVFEQLAAGYETIANDLESKSFVVGSTPGAEGPGAESAG